ncbi:TIGR04222 domain-containing protein [Lentzea fradiae]|uniref:TIGR04222 domain-containing protein n=2 Tax=Lentzea fradiae TaxID=200378 RepID=A0A1G7XRT9_9PSEU|nr:TIGR04222 domain-containing protein [Lentzea fradiae]
MATFSTPHQANWSAEEIAFLAKGPGRAAEAALARLVEGGLVRVSREGLVTAVHQNGYGATTPIEAFVLSGLHGAARPLPQVVQVAAASHEMAALHQSLVARGMVRPQWGQPRGGVRAVRVLLVLLAIVAAIGAIAFNGWIILLALALVVVVVLLRDKGRLTPDGKRVLLYSFRNQRDSAAFRGLNRGGHRSRGSGSHHATGYSGGTHDYFDHSSNCGSSSSCSSSSCGSSSSCSSSSSSSCSSSSCGSSSSSD